MSDPEWAELDRRSQLRGISASAYIRAAIGGGFIVPEAVLKDPAFARFTPAPKPRGKK